MKIQEAVDVQRKLMDGTWKQYDAEENPRKKAALHNRIRSIYVAIACMTVMEGTGIEDRIDAAGIARPDPAPEA